MKNMGDKENLAALTQEVPTQEKSRLERLEQRISQLEKQKQAIQARENEKRRKKLTRRLIQIGALAIKYLDCPNDIEPTEFEEKIKSLIDEKIEKV